MDLSVCGGLGRVKSDRIPVIEGKRITSLRHSLEAKNLRYVSQMLRLAAQHDNSSNNLRQSTSHSILDPASAIWNEKETFKNPASYEPYPPVMPKNKPAALFRQSADKEILERR
jgi:hypothetical protein